MENALAERLAYGMFPSSEPPVEISDGTSKGALILNTEQEEVSVLVESAQAEANSNMLSNQMVGSLLALINERNGTFPLDKSKLRELRPENIPSFANLLYKKARAAYRRERNSCIVVFLIALALAVAGGFLAKNFSYGKHDTLGLIGFLMAAFGTLGALATLLAGTRHIGETLHGGYYRLYKKWNKVFGEEKFPSELFLKELEK